MTVATPSPTITATARRRPKTPPGTRSASKTPEPSLCFPEVAKPHTLTETVDVGPASASALVPVPATGPGARSRAHPARVIRQAGRRAGAGRAAGADAVRRPVRLGGSTAGAAAVAHVQR